MPQKCQVLLEHLGDTIILWGSDQINYADKVMASSLLFSAFGRLCGESNQLGWEGISFTQDQGCEMIEWQQLSYPVNITTPTTGQSNKWWEIALKLHKIALKEIYKKTMRKYLWVNRSCKAR